MALVQTMTCVSCGDRHTTISTHHRSFSTCDACLRVKSIRAKLGDSEFASQTMALMYPKDFEHEKAMNAYMEKFLAGVRERLAR